MTDTYSYYIDRALMCLLGRLNSWFQRLLPERGKWSSGCAIHFDLRLSTGPNEIRLPGCSVCHGTGPDYKTDCGAAGRAWTPPDDASPRIV